VKGRTGNWGGGVGFNIGCAGLKVECGEPGGVDDEEKPVAQGGVEK